MKQEQIDEIMEKVDRRCKFPKHWEEFIGKVYKEHNLIIKDTKNKKLYCTDCKHRYSNKKYKANIGDYLVCPKCYTKHRVYGKSNYHRYFTDSVVLVQRVDKQIVIRVFELYSYYNWQKNKMERSITEYFRALPGIGRFVGNNVYFYTMGNMNIYHGYTNLTWYEYTGVRCFTNFKTYPYNKKRLIKGTILEYAPLKEFQKYFYDVNFLEAIQYGAYESFELLWKLKLYNLSIHASKLNQKGSFYSRFKVPKNFLKYMQENNIEYWQLNRLRLFRDYKIEDIEPLINEYISFHFLRLLKKENAVKEGIKFLEDHYLEYYSIKDFKEISKIVPLRKVLKYLNDDNSLSIYKDYLEMSQKLALNYKSKSDLFPDNLIERHDELQKKIKVQNDINTAVGIYLRFYELYRYIYEDDKYFIFPGNTAEEFVLEGKQQVNCVNSMYSSKYRNKETEIYFMRDKKKINKSLVTVEFKDGKIKQKEQGHHKGTTKEQDEFLEKWTMYRKFVDKKYKYLETKNKNKPKTIKYDLQEWVA